MIRAKIFIWLQYGQSEFFSVIDLWVLGKKKLSLSAGTTKLSLFVVTFPASLEGLLFEVGEDETKMQNETVKAEMRH